MRTCLGLALDDGEPKGWITVNGAHIPLDESGEPTGKAGAAIKAEKWEPTQPFSRDLEEHAGNHVAAALAFYKRELQGKSFSGDFGGEKPGKVQVVTQNWDEIKHYMAKNPIKAELVAHIPEIIETGDFIGRRETPDHKKYSAFLTKFKEVETNGKRVKAMLDVGESKSGLFAYSLNHEGSPTWESKAKYLKERGPQGGEDAKIPEFTGLLKRGLLPPSPGEPPVFLEDSIAEGGEKINLYILEVTDLATGERLAEHEDETRELAIFALRLLYCRLVAAERRLTGLKGGAA